MRAKGYRTTLVASLLIASFLEPRASFLLSRASYLEPLSWNFASQDSVFSDFALSTAPLTIV